MSHVAWRWALVSTLAIVAIAYFAMPVRSQEACAAWKAEMWEDEGGPVLTAFNCADDAPDAYLNLYCSGGDVWLRYDLAYGAERSPDLDEVRDVIFASGGRSIVEELHHQAMDGLFANAEPIGGDLLSLLRTGDVLDIHDADSFYPHRSISLAGSSKAIAALLEDC